jgi:hypothetical protein
VLIICPPIAKHHKAIEIIKKPNRIAPLALRLKAMMPITKVTMATMNDAERNIKNSVSPKSQILRKSILCI